MISSFSLLVLIVQDVKYNESEAFECMRRVFDVKGS